MTKSSIAILVVALVIVAVVVTTQPGQPSKTLTGNGTSNASFFNVSSFLGGLLGGVIKQGAGTPSPSLSTSSNAAASAVADGRPVSQTSGNGLMSLDSLDGSAAVTYA